jgi:chaperonin GroES
MSKVKPLAGVRLKENRILIKDFELVKETKGGIILPEEQWETPVGGLIVSVGPGKVDPQSGILVKNTCKVGEKVQYHKHGTEVEVNGEKYYLVRDSDVWGEME